MQIKEKKEMDDAQVQIETQEAYIKNLAFGDRVAAEAQRIRIEDVQVLENKRMVLTRNINEHRERYSTDERFNRDYFQLQ